METEVTDREQAIQHLNSREYDEAITLLDQLVRTNPSDDELKLLLSTAYSGSTGLNIIDAFQVFRPLIFKDKKNNISFETRQSANLVQDAPLAQDEEANRAKVKKKVVKFFDSLADGFTIAFTMPYSTDHQRRKLVQAILLLDEIDPQSEVYIKARYYSILLNVTQFLNYTKDAFPDLRGKTSLRFSEIVCAFEPNIFFENLDKSLTYFTSAIESQQVIRVYEKKSESQNLRNLYQSAADLSQYYADKQHSSFIADVGYGQLKKTHCE